MFHRPSNVSLWKIFILKKTIFQNGSRWKWENANPKMLCHRHKRGPREVSSITARCVLSGRGLGTHRKSFIPPSECLFFSVDCCSIWLQMGANGRKRYRIISFAIFTGTCMSTHRKQESLSLSKSLDRPRRPWQYGWACESACMCVCVYA